jgi:N-hydroxyarylamine O-acetyltransferase
MGVVSAVAQLSHETVTALLERIGLAEAPAADADGLRDVHRAFVSRVPYESLAVQLGECEPLSVDPLVARVLDEGRGGYCFEINTVLTALLEALGFGVEHRAAIVGARGARAGGEPTNHLTLVVDAGGERFLADAGWGEGPLDPLPLREGPYTAGSFTWSLEREPDGAWWIGHHDWGSSPGFSFLDAPAALEDLALHHARLSTAPESPFVRTLVVQRPLEDRIVTLRARTLFADGPGLRERRVLDDAAEFAATLHDEFGIDAAALGDDRLRRLWARACAQHEAFVRAAKLQLSP